jgi:WXG100 family type VII secretion target
MASVRKLNYDDVSGFVKRFRSEAQDIDALLKQTKGHVENLHNGLWVGEAADKFFNEMETLVFPSIGKLVGALGHAGDVAQKIADTIRQFDEDTKGFFNNLI